MFAGKCSSGELSWYVIRCSALKLLCLEEMQTYWQIYHTTSTWACNYYMLLSMWGDDMGRPNDCNGLQGATPQNPLAEPFPNSQPRQTVNDKKMIDIALIH